MVVSRNERGSRSHSSAWSTDGCSACDGLDVTTAVEEHQRGVLDQLRGLGLDQLDGVEVGHEGRLSSSHQLRGSNHPHYRRRTGKSVALNVGDQAVVTSDPDVRPMREVLDQCRRQWVHPPIAATP